MNKLLLFCALLFIVTTKAQGQDFVIMSINDKGLSEISFHPGFGDHTQSFKLGYGYFIEKNISVNLHVGLGNYKLKSYEERILSFDLEGSYKLFTFGEKFCIYPVAGLGLEKANVKNTELVEEKYPALLSLRAGIDGEYFFSRKFSAEGFFRQAYIFNSSVAGSTRYELGIGLSFYF